MITTVYFVITCRNHDGVLGYVSIATKGAIAYSMFDATTFNSYQDAEKYINEICHLGVYQIEKVFSKS